MKAVFALALVGAVAAVPAGWQDVPSEGTTTPAVPVKETTTTPAVETKTWEDVVSSTTTTTPVKETSTGTWADVSISTTTTTPVSGESSTVWGDHSVPVTETTSTMTAITTYCAKPTSFQDKGETYSCGEGENLTLTKGPYTVTIPIYEETSSVCDTPVAPTGAASTWADVPAPAGPTGSGAPGAPVSPAAPSGGAAGKPAGEEPVSPYTGSASKMAGAGLAGVAAIAALLL